MSGFAYQVADGVTHPLDPHEAIGVRGGLVFIHLTPRNEEVPPWLRDLAKLLPFTPDALTALQTRPRCHAIAAAPGLIPARMPHPATAVRYRSGVAAVVVILGSERPYHVLHRQP